MSVLGVGILYRNNVVFRPHEKIITRRVNFKNYYRKIHREYNVYFTLISCIVLKYPNTSSLLYLFIIKYIYIFPMDWLFFNEPPTITVAAISSQDIHDFFFSSRETFTTRIHFLYFFSFFFFFTFYLFFII